MFSAASPLPQVSAGSNPRRLGGTGKRDMNNVTHRPAMLFLTGLSGSGKSTLATGLEQKLRAAHVLATVVDGDRLRAGLCRDLGFSSEDRHENIRRATELALHLADVGAVVIVALIAPYRSDRNAAAARAKEKGISFAEVFVNAPLSVCETRDPKNLYKRARAGEIASFTGIDSPYESPLAPALELRTDLESVGQSIEKLTTLALKLAGAFPLTRGAPAADS
jgi:bifunctional enzyme CysN/CysC